jgi:hypothetical protein
VSVPPIPTPFDHLGHRPFSFYPPIVNIEHNEWVVQRATWTEVRVMNTKTSDELWVPSRFIGEVSLVDEPVMIVGLVKELEYQAGALVPHVRRVIEMPRAVNDSTRPRVRPPEREHPAPVIGIRLESSQISRAKRLVRGAAGLLACVAVVIVFRDGTVGSRPFTATDDYESIVHRLGPPAEDRWLEIGGLQSRRLWYPRRSSAIILMGGDREHAYYAGTLDSRGRVIRSVELPDGRNSGPLLLGLR